jgi:hypothetical protein
MRQMNFCLTILPRGFLFSIFKIHGFTIVYATDEFLSHNSTEEVLILHFQNSWFYVGHPIICWLVWINISEVE